MKTAFRLVTAILLALVGQWVFDRLMPHDPNVLSAATLGVGALSLLDWAKLRDPDGKVAKVAELLAQRNEILDDMTFMEGNLPTGNRTTVRTSIPTVYWRLLNAGVLSSKSTTAQIDEACGMLEAWSEVDKDLASLNGDIGAFRLSEARPFIEAMNQEMASTLIYGNGTLAPEEFTGLAPRYAAKSGATNSDNVILGGGSGGDNTSIWLVAWSPETVTGIFPKGSTAGLLQEDKGEQVIQNAGGVTGAKMVAMVERWQWKVGLAVKDYRYVVRICNIDISELAGATPADLLAFMGDAEEIIPDGLGKRAFYCNRTVKRYLRRQVTTLVKSGGGLTFENYAGKRVLMYGETPIRTVDAILNNEATIS